MTVECNCDKLQSENVRELAQLLDIHNVGCPVFVARQRKDAERIAAELVEFGVDQKDAAWWSDAAVGYLSEADGVAPEPAASPGRKGAPMIHIQFGPSRGAVLPPTYCGAAVPFKRTVSPAGALPEGTCAGCRRAVERERELRRATNRLESYGEPPVDLRLRAAVLMESLRRELTAAALGGVGALAYHGNGRVLMAGGGLNRFELDGQKIEERKAKALERIAETLERLETRVPEVLNALGELCMEIRRVRGG